MPIKPHGADTLRPLFVSDPTRRDALLREAQGLPSLTLTSAAAANAVMLAAGYFTPLSGYMNLADALSVADNLKTKDGLFWPVPVVNLTKDASAIKGARRIALRDPNVEGNPVLAVMDVKAVEPVSREQLEHMAQKVFGTLFNAGDGFAHDGRQFDHLFVDGEHFTIGALAVDVIAVPGHTSDSCAYLAGDALFPGDSLFMPDGGSARCDFPGGDARTLFRSIQRMFELPDATRVFVCHDYGPGGRDVACETRIDAQKRDNIHVRDGVSESEFVAMREARDATLAMPALLLPAVQVNIRAGALPEPEANGVRYLKLPLDAL